jgi:beta-galactosidase beta subunit
MINILFKLHIQKYRSLVICTKNESYKVICSPTTNENHIKKIVFTLVLEHFRNI